MKWSVNHGDGDQVFVDGQMVNHSFKFSDTVGPAAPTGLVATAGANGVVNLSWTTPSNNQAGFKIERSTDARAFLEIGTVGGDGRTCQDTTGVPNSSYYYRVRAYSPGSGNSACSNVAASRTRGKE